MAIKWLDKGKAAGKIDASWGMAPKLFASGPQVPAGSSTMKISDDTDMLDAAAVSAMAAKWKWPHSDEPHKVFDLKDYETAPGSFTGHFSAGKPNLHQVPKKGKLADMIEHFVAPPDKQAAKSASFAAMYGMGTKKLAATLKGMGATLQVGVDPGVEQLPGVLYPMTAEDAEQVKFTLPPYMHLNPITKMWEPHFGAVAHYLGEKVAWDGEEWVPFGLFVTTHAPVPTLADPMTAEDWANLNKGASANKITLIDEAVNTGPPMFHISAGDFNDGLDAKVGALVDKHLNKAKPVVKKPAIGDLDTAFKIFAAYGIGVSSVSVAKQAGEIAVAHVAFDLLSADQDVAQQFAEWIFKTKGQ